MVQVRGNLIEGIKEAFISHTTITNDMIELLVASLLFRLLPPSSLRLFTEKYRSGSFLGKASRMNVRGELRKGYKNTSHHRDEKTWKTLPKSHARFLYWLGFEPGSNLGLPDKDTTSAIAYLAHDALGRIVERGVMMMFDRLKLEGREVVELRGSEQLTMEDVRKGGGGGGWGGGGGKGTLYWGPGCEER